MIKNKKIYAALVTTLGCVLIFHILGSSIALANDLARLREQRQGLLSETRTAEDSLAEVRQEQNSVLTEIAELDVELDAVSAEYFTAAENLEATTNLLSDTENALIRAEGQRIEQNEILRSRIRFMHENSNYSYIEILFSSANLADFLNNVEHLGQIIEHDNSVLGQLIATEEQISIYRDEVAIRQMEVDLQAQELSVRRHALEEVLEERTAQIVRLDADEQTFLEQIRILEEADREIEQLIRAAEEAERQRVAAAQAQARARNNANQRNNNNSSQQSVAASGPMSWPVQGTRSVNSHYGNRRHPSTGRTSFHTGVDLRAPHGTNVLAAQEGTVIFSGWQRGYGNTIIIDHGGGITTLYAHQSRNLVSSGDRVTRGQVIGRSGATGTATGAHLHFEVRRNGSHINPRPFLGY